MLRDQWPDDRIEGPSPERPVAAFQQRHGLRYSVVVSVCHPLVPSLLPGRVSHLSINTPVARAVAWKQTGSAIWTFLEAQPGEGDGPHWRALRHPAEDPAARRVAGRAGIGATADIAQEIDPLEVDRDQGIEIVARRRTAA